MDEYPSSDVRVYVVWFNMPPGDSRDLVDRKVLNDHRVANYYDPNRVVGSWFAEHTEGGGGVREVVRCHLGLRQIKAR